MARTAKNYEKLISWYRKNYNEEAQDPVSKKFRELFSDFLMFTKPYSGIMTRNGRNMRTRFYDEREWRWIPRITNKSVWTHLDIELFNDENFRNEATDLLVANHKLHFQPEDINYLIIRTENEIDDFIRSLEQIKNRFDSSTIKKLTSRIITKEQIMSDF
jgi:hypothetical protein